MVAPTIIATTYAPVAAPARAPRWFLTTPVSSTPATPIPRPTSTLPPTSATATGTPRTALPSATSPTAPPSAGLRPKRPPRIGPTKDPSAIISTAPACTSPAAPASMPRSARTVSSNGG